MNYGKIKREDFIEEQLEKLKKYLEKYLPDEDYHMQMKSLFRTYMELYIC